MANAQLEALRLENRHLRRSLLSSGDNGAADPAAGEKHVQELQEAYNQSLHTIQVLVLVSVHGHVHEGGGKVLSVVVLSC